METSLKKRKIDLLFVEYGNSHQNKINKAFHWICIPLIFFSIFGLIRCLPVPNFMSDLSSYFSWSSLIMLLCLIYYFSLSLPLFFGFIIWSIIVIWGNEYLYGFGTITLFWISIGLFIVAWIGQFIGHGVEGKKPSFLKDLQFLLIGPAWLMHFIFKRIGLNY